MLTKIDLYREVLAIEPNSKVFFPLAKELAGLDQVEEAVGVLAKGVGFHPDHLEAKFLLVELLTRLGRADEAEEAFAGVGEKLAEYPSVWALWAEKAAFSAKDPGLALRFLAQYFKDGSLTWTSVLESGLNALSPDAVPTAAPMRPEQLEAADAAETAGDEPDHASLDEIALEDYPLADGDAHELMAQAPGVDAYLDEPPLDETGYSLEDELAALDAADSGQALAEASAGEEPDMEEGDEGDEGDVVLRGADEVRSLAGILDDDLVPEDAPETLDASLAASEEGAARESAEKEKSAPETASVQLPDMGVKTMTMAAMLAQQGEAKAALGIYEDLLAAAGSEDERLRIGERIQALRAGSEPAVRDAKPEAKSKRKSKARIAGFLENLAGRLEIRAGA